MKNNKYYRVYAEINLDAIVKNVDNLMALTKENTGALAVVKQTATDTAMSQWQKQLRKK